MKNNYFGGSLKNLIFRGGFTKNQYIGGLSKEGGLGKFADLRGGLDKKERDGVFEGVLIPQCTLRILLLLQK